MRFLCPACDYEGVSNLIPAGDARYAVCPSCATYYQNPMPGLRRPEKELARQEQLLGVPQLVSRSARGQVLAALRSVGVEGPLGTNLDPAALPAKLDAVDIPGLQGDPGRFGAIVLLGFIETCADPVRTIEALREQLRPGGLLMLTAANARFAARVMALKERREPHIRNVGALLRPDRRKVVFSPRGLCELFGRTGFSQVRVGSAAPTVTDKATSQAQALTYGLSRLIDLVAPRLTLAGSVLCFGLRKE